VNIRILTEVHGKGDFLMFFFIRLLKFLVGPGCEVNTM